jgi:hypothetical protein
MIEESTNGGGSNDAVSVSHDPEVRALEATFRALQTDILLARAAFARQAGLTFDGKRDEYEVLGYGRQITNRQYREEYSRGGIAGRIVDVMPDATWRGDPAMELVENENPDTDTPFEQAWKELDRTHQICSKLQRVDRLARLSTYAVLLIGVPGELDAEVPKGTPEQLLYLMPFSGGGGPGGSTAPRTLSPDADCTIAEYETDAKSPRFGLPRTYQLKRTDVSSPDFQRPVHWTRIVHVAEGLLDDEVFGQPALERVWNLLIDLRKVTGGGSEAFWLRANQGLHLDIDKDMALPDAKDTIAALKEQADAYKHQLDRWIRTRGVDVKTLGSDVANFANPADAIITQIAGAKSIPKRILTGSEMGELASSQDRENFKDQINGRQTQYAGPYIVRPLVNRLIQFGYLPTPAKGPEAYTVRWPHIQTLTEQEKSAGALSWAQTVVGSEPVFTDSEIRDKWYGMIPLTDEQREEIAERKAEAVKRQQDAMGGPAPADEEEDDDDDEEKAGRFPRAAQTATSDDSELIAVLEAAITANNTDVIDQILGLRHEQSAHTDQTFDLRDAGGAGSGNFGHAGRPGEIGGSASQAAPDVGSGGGSTSTSQLKQQRAVLNDVKRELEQANREPTPGGFSFSYGSGLDFQDVEEVEGGVQLSVRNFGDWMNPPDAEDEEDYDWQIPTQATVKKLDAIVGKIQAKHPDLEVKWYNEGEKNWIGIQVLTPGASGHFKKRSLGGRHAAFNPDQPRDDQGQWTEGNFGASERPTFDPTAIRRMVRESHLTGKQTTKLHTALQQIHEALQDPDIGAELWSVLSSFTPQSLRERLSAMETGLVRLHARPSGTLPKPFYRAAARAEVEHALDAILQLALDPDIGELVQQFLLAAIASKNKTVFQVLGGAGSGNFGHVGRPGEIGGSASGGATGIGRPGEVGGAASGAPGIGSHPEVSDIGGEDTLTTPEPHSGTATVLGQGGINGAKKLVAEDGKTYLYKPVSSERFIFGDTIFENRAANLAERETLASRVAQELGMSHAPVARYGQVPEALGGNGALMDWVDNAQGLPHPLPADLMSRFTNADRAEQVVYDTIIGNVDRHDGNFMVKNDKLIPIDHGYSFGRTYPVAQAPHDVVFSDDITGNVFQTHGHMRNVAAPGMDDSWLSKEAQTTLAGKIEKIRWSRVLRGSHLSVEEQRALRLRTETVVTRLKAGELGKLKTDFQWKEK